MHIESGTMFLKKSRSKTNVGSRESLDGYRSGGNISSPGTSNENLAGSRDKLVDSVSTMYGITQFEIHFLGMVQDVNLGGIQSRDPDVQLIDKVEEAQLEDKINLVIQSEDMVTLTISKYGVKVLGQDKKEVLQRHPLHTVAQSVYYIDSFMKHNVALKIGQVGRSVYDCYVFQCHSEEQAQNMCSHLKTVFNIVTNHSH